MSTRAAKKASRKIKKGGTTKTPASKATKPPARKRAAKQSATGLKVRMYRVGFGDFFLLTVPTSAGDRYIVIDCGVFKGKTGKGDIGSIVEAVEDLYETTGGQLALVIMTHRHADHIAGFSRAKRFQDFKASMVWMPYWEQFNDAKASEAKKLALADSDANSPDAHNLDAEDVDDQNSPFFLQRDVDQLATQLGMRFSARTDSAAQQALHQLWNATGIDFSATAKDQKKGGSNAQALDLLKNHLGNNGKNVRYYAAGDEPELPPELEGLSAEIFGPPAKGARAFMKLTDLKKNVGQYLDSTSDGDDGDTAMKPFQSRWLADPKRDYPDKDARGYAIDYEKITREVNISQPDMLAAAADKVETFLNNQSLVVLFKFGGKNLLFVGDAQAGNWENWLYTIDAPNRDPTKIGNLKADSQELLRTIDFYKVGHHGSTNATPIQVVDAMNTKHAANGFVAMCSTQADTFGNPDNDSEVPRIPLMKALADGGCALVRSDSFAITLSGEKKPIPAGVRTQLPKPKVGKLTQKGLYIEYSF